MHTHREHTLTRSAFGGLAFVAGIAVLLVALAAFLSTPAVAGAKVHSFTAVKVKKGVAKFRVKHVSPGQIRSARVLGPKGTKKLSLKRIRRAARRGYLRVRVTRRGKHRLHVKSKRARIAASAKRRKSKPTPPPTTEPAPPTTEPAPPTTEPAPPTTEPAPPTTEPAPPTTEPAPPTTEPAPPPVNTPPPDPVLVIETPDPPTPPETGVCTTDLNQLAPGQWPPACWRPFADTSPFNRQIPAGARLTSDSSSLVANLRSAGSGPKAGRANIPEGDDYHKNIYWARSTDPEFTVRGGSTTAPYDVDGRKVRMPEVARQTAGGDAHLGIVYNGEEWCFYQASVDPTARTITVNSGRRISLAGDGRNAAATSARFGCLAGRIRYQEFEAGQINHAIFMSASTTGSSFVYPALKSDGPQGAGYPPMGTRFQLDPSYATDAWLAGFPAWKRAILRALRDYGGYLGDTTTGGWTAMPFESEVGYYSYGLPRPFAAYASSRDSADGDISLSGGTYYFNLASGVDWSRLRVLDPCVAQGTC